MKHHNARFLAALTSELQIIGFNEKFIILMLLEYIDQNSIRYTGIKYLSNSDEVQKFFNAIDKISLDFAG